VAVALCGACGLAEAQGQFGTPSTSSRQAEDRRVDESARQTQSARQTEAPKPADGQKAEKAADGPARNESKPAFGRQSEPQRQAEPQRQREPRRQHDSPRTQEPSRRNDSDHWSDPGPAWRSNGPAWRDLNDRPGVQRPGEDAFRATPNTFAPRDRDRRDRDSRRGNRTREVYIVPYGIPVPYYESVPYPSTEIAVGPPPAVEPRADDRPLGFLQLRVTPRTAEVAVDGAPVGTVDDFGGRGARMLPAGPHRVEITAPGFDTLTIDVRVPENDTVTFTRDLDPATNTPAPEPVTVPHKTMYIVPMCFIGDRPPLPGDMPAGCRVEDVRVIP
jgi:hypothetical protein